MQQQTEKNFRYHQFYTDSENFVKDIARVLALGYQTDSIIGANGETIKAASPIVDENWTLVYPKVDRTVFPDVQDWNKLTSEEYAKVTAWQISQIKDTIILRTTTIPKNVELTKSDTLGFDADLNKTSTTMHLEIYFPPYLTDSETDDPFKQRQGTIPTVSWGNGNTKSLRNYYHAYFRIFDNINEDGTGPAENILDPVTRSVITWNSRSSEWAKLSWYNDFEEVFKDEAKGALSGYRRDPVESGITSQTKIKLWCNVNRNRLVLACMGSSNVDYSENRYFTSCAYVGQIESFDFSLNDTAGNFGLFTTSSTLPAIKKTTTSTRPPQWYNTASQSNVPAEAQYGIGRAPRELTNNATTIQFELPTPIDVAYDSKFPDKEWGTRYIDASTVNVYFDFTKTNGKIGELYNSSGVRLMEIDFNGTGVIIEGVRVEVDNNNRKYATFSVKQSDLVDQIRRMSGYPKNDVAQVVLYNTPDIKVSFKTYMEYTTLAGGVTRDSFGNVKSVNYPTTYGKNTANATNDFAMYHTYAKDYFQKHYFMFSTTEEFMQKELYGKSIYTGEYFADRIKVVHGSEGPRGILKGLITIENSSLYPFDELIVNKDFAKYANEPEELFVYLPITAPFSPFNNSPNSLHGIGILKEIRYPVPESELEIVNAAVREMENKYLDLKYVTNNLPLVTVSEYNATIAWQSSDTETIIIGDDEGGISTAIVKRPGYDDGDKTVKLTALVTKGSETRSVVFVVIVKKEGLSDSQATILDSNWIVVPTAIKANITLPKVGPNGCEISWSSSAERVITNTGVVTRPDKGEANTNVTLTATCKKGSESQTKQFEVSAIAWNTQDELDNAKSLATFELIKGTNKDKNNIIENLSLPATIGRNVSAVYKSSAAKVCSDAGVITRPTFTEGPVSFAITVTLTTEELTDTVVIDGLWAQPKVITNKEVVTLAKNSLNETQFLGDNSSLTEITKDMILPKSISNANLASAVISWKALTMDDQEYKGKNCIVSDASTNFICKVVRPSSTEANAQLKLVATIASNDDKGGSSASDTKEFVIVIPRSN